MITSWNVNRFLKTEIWSKLKNEHMEEIWNRPGWLEDIFSRISTYLPRNGDILILHEVPFKLRKEKRFEIDVCMARKSFEDYCSAKGYEILPPFNVNDSYSQTLAIFYSGNYDYDGCYQKYVKDKFTYKGNGFRNKIIGISRKKDAKEVILGVHVPTENDHESAIYFDSLIHLHRKMSEDKPVYYIGDLNAFLPNKLSKRKMHEFMAEGLEDYWLAAGKSNIYPTHTAGERLDYVLVSTPKFKSLTDYNEFFGRREIFADDTVMGKLSDHSAIMLGTPSELEPFKTKT